MKDSYKFLEHQCTEIFLTKIRVTVESPHLPHSATSIFVIDERDLLEIEPLEKPYGIETSENHYREWLIEKSQRDEKAKRMIDMIANKIAMDLVRHIANRDENKE